MALNTAVNFLCYRFMREFFYISMAVSTGDIFVCRIGINIFINVITSFSSQLIDPTDLLILMSHQTVFFVCAVRIGNNKGEQEKYRCEKIYLYCCSRYFQKHFLPPASQDSD